MQAVVQWASGDQKTPGPLLRVAPQPEKSSEGSGLLEAMHSEQPDCNFQWPRGTVSLEAVCEVLSVVQVEAHQPLQV